MSKRGIFISIIGGALFLFLIIALVLYFAGFRHIELDDGYYKVIQTASIRSNSWNIEIPNIPNIPYGQNVGFGWDVLRVLTDIGNFFVNFFNIIISVINVVLDLFMFVVSLISLLKDIPEILG